MILSQSASLIDISELGMVALLYSPALSWKVPILLQLEASWSIIFPSEQSVVSLKSILFIFLMCNATISNTQWTTHKDKVKRWIEGSKIKRNGKKVWKYAHACITCLKIELESLFDIEWGNMDLLGSTRNAGASYAAWNQLFRNDDILKLVYTFFFL